MTTPPVGLGDADSDEESGGFIIDLDSRNHSRVRLSARERSKCKSAS